MKYAFLTSLIPEQMQDTVASKSKNNMPEASNALQWHIYDGLCANLKEDIKIFNILPIGSFPQYYSSPFVKKTMFRTEHGKNNINIGFCNVKLIRKYHQPKKIFTQLKKWCAEDNEAKTLLIYSASAHLIKAVYKIKKIYPSLTVCVIIADLPNMDSLSSKKGLVQKLFDRKLAADSYSSLRCVDGYVLLTKQMADYMKIDKPFCVMEGISTSFANIQAKKPDTDAPRIVMYSGTLHRKFGILNLVEAFQAIKSPDYRLVICGIGDSQEEVKKAADQDSRIDFKGQLPRAEVLALQQTATVLVNPRQNNEEFTKYSFPSKNLEYLSSGIPLVAYKLDGIPDEYDDYINYVSDNSVEALRDKLTEALEDKDGSIAARALAAANFVRDEKNAQTQTRKIIGLLESLPQ